MLAGPALGQCASTTESKRAVQFLLNGEPRDEAGVPPTMTVLDWLRARRAADRHQGRLRRGRLRRLHHRGRPRRSADELQYQAVNSCLMMLPQLDGCAVLTVEGLAAADGTLHPVQQALVDADATQCGFCTPGFVMAMFAFHHGGEPARRYAHSRGARRQSLPLHRLPLDRGGLPPHRRRAGRPLRRRGGRDRGRVARACRHAPTIATAGRFFSLPRSLDELFAALAAHPGRAAARRRHRSRAARQQGSRGVSRR